MGIKPISFLPREPQRAGPSSHARGPLLASDGRTSVEGKHLRPGTQGFLPDPLKQADSKAWKVKKLIKTPAPFPPAISERVETHFSYLISELAGGLCRRCCLLFPEPGAQLSP